jgi:succinate-acetate transporter protein
LTTNQASIRPIAMADPLPIAYGLFAFTLAIFGIRFVGVDAATIHGPTSDALNYAILIAGVAELLGGVLAIIRGVGYSGWVPAVFGVWLIGFYLLIIHTDAAAAKDSGILKVGPDGKPLPAPVTSALQNANITAWHADSIAWYVWILLIPVVILAVPAFERREVPFMVAFVAVVVLLALLGSAFHSVYSTLTDVTRGRAVAPELGTAVHLLKASAYASFIASAAVFWAFTRKVLRVSRAEHSPAVHAPAEVRRSEAGQARGAALDPVKG